MVRRRAIFGAVAVPLALMVAPGRARATLNHVDEVIRPDAESKSIDMIAKDALDEMAKIPDDDEEGAGTYVARAATAKAGELVALLARTPATNRADLVHKAIVLWVADDREIHNAAALGVSVAHDVVRIDGGAL